MEALDHSKDGARAAQFDAAAASFNAWRGRMIGNFGRAEQAVSETLLVLVETGAAPKGTKLPHLTGQRFAALTKSLASLDPALPHVAPALKALEEFRQRHEVLRRVLCHGAERIALDRRGQWIALIKIVEFKSGSIARTARPIEEATADDDLAQLEEDRRRLTSALGQVKALAKEGPAPYRVPGTA